MINHHCLIFPQLSAVSCGNPGTPAHGRIVFSDGITFGSSVAYACWEGFKTSGLTTRHCTTNGTWTGQPPDCTGTMELRIRKRFVNCRDSRQCSNHYETVPRLTKLYQLYHRSTTLCFPCTAFFSKGSDSSMNCSWTGLPAALQIQDCTMLLCLRFWLV